METIGITVPEPGETAVATIDGSLVEIRPLGCIPDVVKVAHEVARWANHGWAIYAPVHAYTGVECVNDVVRAYRRACPEQWTDRFWPGITGPAALHAPHGGGRQSAEVSVGQALTVEVVQEDYSLEIDCVYTTKDGQAYTASYSDFASDCPDAPPWGVDEMATGRFRARLMAVLAVAVQPINPSVAVEIVQAGDRLAGSGDDPEFSAYWAYRDRPGHLLAGPTV